VNRTVLIVDDHPSFRATARMLLESEGYDVVGEAPDGTTAIAAARELRPDLVLLDVNLPDLDGFDVAARLTGDADAPAVVLVSSRDAGDFRGMVGRTGARGFLSKADLSGPALEALLPA
jgi:DNA-binding NarL/FixJ family response regulator